MHWQEVFYELKYVLSPQTTHPSEESTYPPTQEHVSVSMSKYSFVMLQIQAVASAFRVALSPQGIQTYWESTNPFGQ